MQEFKLQDVLSVILCRRIGSLNGLRDILTYVTGDECIEISMKRQIDIAKPVIESQCPLFMSGNFQFARGQLIECLEIVSDKDPRNMITGWMSQLKSGNYGPEKQGDPFPEIIELEPLPSRFK